MTEPTRTEQLLESVGAGYLRLYRLLGEVGDAQWMPSQHPVPKEDVTIRSRGLKSDPTFHVFNDRGRRELREAVLEAEEAMRIAERTMTTARARIARARTELSGLPESEPPYEGKQ